MLYYIMGSVFSIIFYWPGTTCRYLTVCTCSVTRKMILMVRTAFFAMNKFVFKFMTFHIEAYILRLIGAYNRIIDWNPKL